MGLHGYLVHWVLVLNKKGRHPDASGYSRVSNSSAGTTSGFSAMGRPAWKQNRVPAAKIGNPALQLGKEKSAGRGPIRPGFLSISSPIDLRSGK